MTKQVSKCLNVWSPTGWRWLAGWGFLLLTISADAQMSSDPVLKRCATGEVEQMRLQQNPNRLQQFTRFNQLIEQRIASQQQGRLAVDTTVYRIPVVVHVVHNNASNTIGGANNGNISDAQIATQIQVLNEDYRRKAGTNGYNGSTLSADARFEFYLARTDPDGNQTTGITRHYSTQSSFNVFNNADVQLAQIVHWPSDHYLNIWVTSVQDNYIGYTQFPVAADTLRGLPGIVNNDTDGTIIDYRVFGRQTGTVTSSLYNLGRTVTHEIGHWLGLIHPWGDGAGCNDDYVADTPLTADRSTAPTTCNQTYSTCVAGVRTRDLVEDYMMYSPDNCMNLFTVGQVARMRAVMNVSPRRRALLQNSEVTLPSSEELTINVSPNPASSDPSVDVYLNGNQSFEVGLYDMAGRQLRSIAYTNAPSTRLTLPVTGLSSGIYIVRVKTGSQTVSKRLLLR